MHFQSYRTQVEQTKQPNEQMQQPDQITTGVEHKNLFPVKNSEVQSHFHESSSHQRADQRQWQLTANGAEYNFKVKIRFKLFCLYLTGLLKSRAVGKTVKLILHLVNSKIRDCLDFFLQFDFSFSKINHQGIWFWLSFWGDFCLNKLPSCSSSK